MQREIKKEWGDGGQEPPTFQEYWHYLTNLTAGLERPQHWRGVDCVQAYYSVCVPCDVQYDVIIKLETHDQDAEFLIRRENLTELQEGATNGLWKHNSKAANRLGDYDYYLYDEDYRNPVQFSKQQQEISENSLGLAADEEKQKDEKLEYKKRMVGQLTKEEVRQLYQNYAVDFEMFGYDIEEFLAYAK